MARFKPQLKKINNLEEADLVLKDIGVLERELEQIDAEAQKQIGEIKAKAVRDGEHIRSKITELTSLLGAYAEYNRELFTDKKTVELTFGCFGYRKSTSIHIKKSTLELLKRCGLSKYIRIKEEPNKEAMSELDDETLAQVDAVRKIKDSFFCETNREEINKSLLQV